MDDKLKTTEYNPQEIEKKWQETWFKNQTFTPDLKNAKNPYYTLMMFPYPSAEGLHVGNMYAFTGADVHGRFMRMQGKDVFEPIGLDGFGIHSENYALKVGKHPAEQAKVSQKNFYRQLRATGNGYDWTRTLETYDPAYYRWTQWLFIQMFKKGLAYRKKAQVNWCPSDKTVLADEQVIDGKCERDGAVVEKRDLEQWFFKITDYADALLNGLIQIDWPEKIKIAQRQWIGKSEGARIKFDLRNIPGQEDGKHSVEVFTTRPDTLFGVTFLVISPELANSWLSVGWKAPENVKDYVKTALVNRKNTKADDSKEKSGVNSEVVAINPVNQEEIPVWISDYVLSDYGTGAIMAVPAHDERDFEFAKKFNLQIQNVILNDSEGSGDNKAYVGEGKITNSEDWNGWQTPNSIGRVIDWLEEKGIGKRESNYHLRDWLISRQRYWGPPIPMIFCESCASKGLSWFTSEDGQQSRLKIKDLRLKSSENRKSGIGNLESMSGWYPVPEEELPVLLPDVEDWRPQGSGISPLANHPEFYETKCPSCNSPARRETDVSDTFLDSAWYYLRYLSIQNPVSSIEQGENISKDIKSDQSKNSLEIRNLKLELPYDPQVVKAWYPVAIYIGGSEHSVLHLLYVRFVAMVLNDLNSSPSAGSGQDLKLPEPEPFPRFFAHGLIVKDGAKMSKSRGNVVIPDKYIEKFGADTVRMYLMFLGQFSEGGDFRDSGIEGMYRFVKRVWTLLTKNHESRIMNQELDQERLRFMHKTIKGVTEDIASFSYNTAIAKMMEWYNFLSERITNNEEQITNNEAEVFLKLFAPFAPHFTEEIFSTVILSDSEGSVNGSEKDSSVLPQNDNKKTSIHFSAWPTFNEKYLVQDEVVIPIQINGKRRGEFSIKYEVLSIKYQKEVEERAKEVIKAHLEGKEVKKVIYVPGKIINFVV